MSLRAIDSVLKRLVIVVPRLEFRKRPRGPKRSRKERQSGVEINRLATAELLG